MVLWTDVVVLVQDGANVLFAGFNAAYFAWYGQRRAETRSRRVAAAALAVLNGSIALEAVLFLGLFIAVHGGVEALPLLRSGAAIGSRSFLLAASTFITLLIWRQRRRGN